MGVAPTERVGPTSGVARTYGGRVNRSLRTLAVATLAAASLAGCATVKPASTVPPTGWPDAPATSRTPAPATPTAPAKTPAFVEPTQKITRAGFVIPVPTGYVDATALVSDAPTTGATQLVAFLRSPGQHTITVQTVATDKQDFASFLTWYVTAQNAGTEASVTAQKDAKVGGLQGAEITLKASDDGGLSTLFVAMRSPGSLITVSGASDSEPQRRALEAVATWLATA